MLFSFFMRKIIYWQNHNSREHDYEDYSGKYVSISLRANIEFFKAVLGKSDDIRIHEFMLGDCCELGGAIIYVNGLVDNSGINENILKPIMLNKKIKEITEGGLDAKDLKSCILYADDIEESNQYSTLLEGCLSGNTILLINGLSSGLIIGTKGWEKRSVTEPQTESVVRGPREGFTEDFGTNTALLRRRIKSTRFKMENMTIGRETSTNVCIAYIEGIVKPEMLMKLRHRLRGIDVDSIIDSGYIEEYIEDYPFSIFSTIGYSEKPDVIAAKILEGRIAIIVDGSPFVLTVPMLFVESFQTAEDYYVRSIYASIIRMMRYLAYFIAIFAVPGFIALTTFHHELIPTTLLFTIANAREGTPFPALLEGLIMVISFEILREAGLRLPRAIGQAISIVGALIMGDAAVSAGIVGAPMVITVAIAAVSGFIIPEQADSISILRIILMILASILGGFGIAVGFLGMLIHLSILEPFGIPYFASVEFSRDQQDSFIRLPLWAMEDRPEELVYENKKRMQTFIPPNDDEKDKDIEK